MRLLQSLFLWRPFCPRFYTTPGRRRLHAGPRLDHQSIIRDPPSKTISKQPSRYNSSDRLSQKPASFIRQPTGEVAKATGYVHTEHRVGNTYVFTSDHRKLCCCDKQCRLKQSRALYVVHASYVGTCAHVRGWTSCFVLCVCPDFSVVEGDCTMSNHKRWLHSALMRERDGWADPYRDMQESRVKSQASTVKESTEKSVWGEKARQKKGGKMTTVHWQRSSRHRDHGRPDAKGKWVRTGIFCSLVCPSFSCGVPASMTTRKKKATN